jgi:hypothetical protein
MRSGFGAWSSELANITQLGGSTSPLTAVSSERGGEAFSDSDRLGFWCDLASVRRVPARTSVAAGALRHTFKTLPPAAPVPPNTSTLIGLIVVARIR